VWPSQAYLRITLELEQRLRVRHQMFDAPLRLVIDLQELRLDDALRALPLIIPSDDPWIAQLRVGQFQPTVVRLVFLLRQPIRTEIFELPPVGPYQRRWMIDLHPDQEPDPLQALLQRRLALKADEPGLEQLIEGLREREAQADRSARRERPPAGSDPPPPPGIAAARPYLPPIVAIDAGHGGEDPGAIGPGGLREKDVVLDISRRLAERFAGEKGLRPALIREADYFVPLGQRVRKARALRAEVMLSVHADAFTEAHAKGASAFVLSEGAASSASARYLARKENGADEIGGVDLGRRDKDAARILLELSTRTQIRESSDLAAKLLRELGRIGPLHKPSVERAGFAVLRAPDIPSVLVETAFISNPQEEERLADPGFREQLAEALHRGIRHYLVASAATGAPPR
jgi:N-acetylmuramoyl-L-alanine amidase